MRLNLFALLFSAILSASSAFASGPAGGAIQGTLTGPSGAAITNPSVDFAIQILDSAGACVMYQEEHLNVDLSATNGDFSLNLGEGANAQNFVDATAVLKDNIFRNDTNLGAFAGCAGGLTFNPGDGRLVRVRFDVGGGYVLLTPDMEVQSSPYAVVANSADKIQGKEMNLSSVSGASGDKFAMLWDQGLNRWVARALNVGDIASAGGQYFTYQPNNVPCAVGEVLKWTASNRWECAPDSSGSAGVTYLSAGAGLLGGNITATGSLAVDVGTGPNQIVQLDGTSRLPAVNGSLLTNVNAVTLQGNLVSPVAPVMAQVLKWNGSAWTPSADSDSGGDITSVNAGTGLTGGALFGDATLHVDVGIAVNQIPQLKANGALGIGTNTPAAGAIADFYGATAADSAVVLPRASTGTRPATSINGMIRYNTSLAKFEVYENGDWYNMATGTGADNLGNHIATTNVRLNSNWLSNDGDNEGIRIDNAGFVGVRTATPNQALHVVGNIELEDNNPKFVFDDNNNADVYVQNTNGDLSFKRDDDTTVNFMIEQLGRVGVGTNTPNVNSILDVNGSGAMSAMIVPRDSTGNRPTGVNGMIRYNTNTSKMEVFENNAWVDVVQAADGGIVTLTGENGALVSGPATVKTISIDTGVTAGQIVQVAAGDRLPVIDGSLLTQISNLRNVNVSTTAPTSNQVLRYNGSAWEAATLTDNAGVTLVAMGSGMVPGDISATGTISIDVGTGPNQIVQLDGSSRIPAIDGSLLTNVNAASIRGVNVSTTAPTGSQVLQYNGSAWAPADLPAANAVAAGTAILLSGPASMRTISVDVGIGANQVPQLNGSGFLGIGTATVTTGAVADFFGASNLDSAVVLPRATTANRPTTGVNGMIRYNTSLAKFEVYENGNWANMVGSGADNLGNHTATTNIQLGSNWLSGDGGNEGVRVDNNGLVAIGTTTFVDALTVVGSTSDILHLKNTNNAGTTSINFSDDGGNQQVFFGWGNTGSGAFGDLAVWGTNNAKPLVMMTNSLERIRVDSSGRVGIGTTSPNTAAVLDVNGTGNLSAMIVPRATTAQRPITGVNGMIRYNTNTSKFEVYTAGNWANITTGSGSSSQWVDGAGGDIYYNGGSVGIGITNPTAAFEIDYGTNTGRAAYIYSSAGTTANNPLVNLYTSNAAFDQPALDITYSGTTEALGIYNSGSSTGIFVSQLGNNRGLYVQSNVGAAAGSPLVEFSANNATFDETPLVVNNFGAGNSFVVNDDSGDTTPFVITSGGFTGIGTSTPNSKLEVYYDGGVAADGLNGGASATFTANRGAGSYAGLTLGYWVSGGSEVGGAIAPSSGGAGDIVFAQNNTTENMRLTYAGRLGIGSSSPTAGTILDANGTGVNFSSILIPRDTTANRPTGVNGMIRYNTNSSKFEVYASGSWTNLVGSNSLTAAGNNMELQFNDNGVLGGSGAMWNTGSSLLYISGGLEVEHSAGAEIQGYNSSASVLADATLFNLIAGSSVDSGSSHSFLALNASQDHTATAAGNYITFSTVPNNTETAQERMRISSAGNVGIGTTAPSTPLEIKASASGGFNAWQGTAATNFNILSAMSNNKATTYLDLDYQDGNGVRFDVTGNLLFSSTGNYSFSGGSVGIGTANPTKNVQIGSTDVTGITSGAAGSQLLVVSDSNGAADGEAAIRLAHSSNNDGWWRAWDLRTGWAGNGDRDNFGIYDVTAGAYRMTINTAGSVGIGTSSPNSASVLDVNGTGNLSSLIVPRATTAERPVTAANGMIRYNTNTARFEAYENGNWVNMIASGGGGDLLNGGNTGNVVVGSNTGSAAVEAGGTSYMTISSAGDVTIDSSNGGMDIQYASSSRIFIANPIALTPEGSNPVYINSGTGLGLFDTSPEALIEVSANGSTATPFFMLSSNDANDGDRMIVTGVGRVGLGSNNPTSGTLLDVNGTGVNFSSIIIPRDTTANRPTGVNGMIRYNTNTSKFEVYTAGNWADVATGSGGSQWTTSGSNIYYDSGAASVGTNDPLEKKFRVFDTKTTVASGWSSAMGSTVVGAPGGASVAEYVAVHGRSERGSAADLSGGKLVGVLGNTENSYTGTIESAEGVTGYVQQAAGTITYAVPFQAVVELDGGTVDFYKGINVSTIINSGTISNAYGIYINDLAATVGFGVFQAGANDNNYFAGKIGIGTDTPTAPLDVNGGASYPSARFFGSGGYSSIEVTSGTTNRTTITTDTGDSFIANNRSSGTGALWLGAGTFTTAVGIRGSDGRVTMTGTQVGIGTSNPNSAAILDVNGTGNLSALIVPRATTAQRPVPAANGMIRYNTNTAKFEAYENDKWNNIVESGYMGSATLVGASNCSWSTTGTSWTSITSTDTDCGSHTATEYASAPTEGKIPGIRFASLSSGAYQIFVTIGEMDATIGTAATECRYRIWDGSTESGRVHIHSELADRTSQIQGIFRYSSDQSNITYYLQYRRSTGDGTCAVMNDDTDMYIKFEVVRISN